jgi:hypothetical protein
MTRFQQFQFAIAAVGALGAAFSWFAFVRQVPERSGPAVVRAKEFVDAHTYSRYPSNVYRQNWTPTPIRIGAADVLTLDLEGRGTAFFAMDTSESRAYAVGQKVEVRFEVRGIPAIWEKVRVKGIRPSGG